MMTRQYITTAIDYPNAAPHMGHVLEKVLADVCARWMRLRGDAVRFQIGTDEHGIKIQQTAEREKMTPKELVDRNVPLFEDLYRRLAISSDVFIRTSDHEKHWPTVVELWMRLQKAGVLEKRTYTGLYCSGCERFLTKKDLVDGLCENHKKAPEEVKEENWFFILSKETAWLKKLLSKEYRIIPAFREKETLALLDQGLEDVSFSRPKSSLSWGIPVPGDEAQTMYVWCDALTNYISGLGYFTDHEEKEYWDDATVTHVIGKDIARFHALIWPAMLKHAGVRTPDQLLIHGFLTSEGQKMSKSTGNVVVPDDVLQKFGGNPDPLRFYLSHEVPVGNDGDFSWKRIEELYIGVLSNKIGNLLNRVLVLLQKNQGQLLLQENDEASNSIKRYWALYQQSMDRFEVNQALTAAVAISMGGNVRMDERKPWTLKGDDQLIVLSVIAEQLRHIALMLLPFMPETAQKMSVQLGVPYAGKMLEKDFVITKELQEFGGVKGWKKIGTPAILFAPLS
jgi:methionyl-tRNA synthetase